MLNVVVVLYEVVVLREVPRLVLNEVLRLVFLFSPVFLEVAVVRLVPLEVPRLVINTVEVL